ncbi:LPXTG cell wall anchor domain-containing protein [Candidatus Woesearchaeota archaeon]|nr:LPXTG cell wall anchor domain-containing protein [Candidatus Woesearchaeota archaeon]
MIATTKIFIFMILAAFFFPLASAQVAIDSFIVSPEKVIPGNEAVIEMTLENVGSDGVKDVLAVLDFQGLPFVPIESSNEKVIRRIYSRDDEIIFFRIKVLPTAEPAVYTIPVAISYDDVSKISLISIEVAAPAHLAVLLQKSEIVKVNDQGKVTIKMVNDGLAMIKNLKIQLRESPAYRMTSPSTLYVGEVDIGDFETEEFNLMVMMEDPLVVVDVEYRDSANTLYTESKLFKLPVYSKEEAEQLGLVEKNSLLLPVIGIIILLGTVLIYRRRKRKNHAL